MSTNANIQIKRADGTHAGIYLHWDGYIEYAGELLQLYYNTAEKVEKLIALGDLSVIGKTTNADDPAPDDGIDAHASCIAYHRDRGEGFHQTENSTTAEYIYMFNALDNVWMVQQDEWTRREKCPAAAALCMDYVRGYRCGLLLDEILNAKAEYIPDNEKDACKKAAYNARRADIARAVDEYNAFYSAYCD